MLRFAQHDEGESRKCEESFRYPAALDIGYSRNLLC